jgi:hypothetical protein
LILIDVFKKNMFLITLFIFASLVVAGSEKYERDQVVDPYRNSAAARIGDHPFPTNPMNDRAIG